MIERVSDESRRAFLSGTGKLAAAATAAAAFGTAARTVRAESAASAGGKEIIPGSPSSAYSRAVKLDRLVFVAGCVGRYEKDGKPTLDKDFRSQAEQTLKNLKASVEAAGSTLDNVLKCTCFLKEYADFQTFNSVYMSFFPRNPPARSTVVVKDFVVPDALLEVDCVCCVD